MLWMRGDSNRYQQHMILWRNIANYHFFTLISTPDLLHFYFMLDANLGSLSYGDVPVMDKLYRDEAH